MRRFYSFIMLAFVALLAAQSARAFTITFNAEHDGCAIVTANSQTWELHEGANEIEFEFIYSYCNVEVAAADGWKLVSVTSDDPEEYSDMYMYGGVASEYMYPNLSGRSYTVHCDDVSQTRTSQVTVNIDKNASQVSLSRDGMKVPLVDGENIVKFDPATESQLVIRNMSYSPFYKITCNGDAVPLDQYSSFSYTIDAENGDIIDIMVDYPDVDVPVTFTSNIPEAIRSVSVNYSTVDWQSGPLTLKAGTNVNMTLNDDYKIISVTNNGEEMAVSTYMSFKVDVDPVEIVVNAERYPDLSFTINVDDPSRVNVYPGSSDYGTPYTLVSGDNALTISEKIASVFVKATTGNYIESITDGDGNELSLMWYTLSGITDGMQINIRTAEIVNDSQFAIFFNGERSSYTKLTYDGTVIVLDDESGYYAGDNYWVFPFCKSAGQSFNISFDPDPRYTSGCKVYAYKNMDFWEESSYMGSRDVTPLPDMVFYGFAGHAAPAVHTVSFDVAAALTDKMKVTRSLVNAIDDWSAGVEAFEGTVMSVNCAGAIVTVDGTALSAADENEYKFVVTGDHAVEVTVDPATSIAEVMVEDGADITAVYNMQGVKVSDSVDNLPAGIYLVRTASGVRKMAVK